MNKVPAIKIVRAINVLRKGGRGTVFNDRIRTGRSIKVWGWREQDYSAAMQALIDAGYRVELVRTPALSALGVNRGGALRMHVRG